MLIALSKLNFVLRKECIDMMAGTDTLALTIAPDTLLRLLSDQHLSGCELHCLDKRSKEKLKALLLESACKQLAKSTLMLAE